jgi:cytidylate kinase
MKRINIAIDGPSGAGKSTLARSVARALGIHYLDTGAMYRAVAYAAASGGADITDPEQVADIAENVDLRVVYEDGEQRVLLDGNDVMPFIRTPEISKAASDISAYPCVRLKLVEMQREVARSFDVVLDGRDIGTFVLPDAEYKFFLTADIHERAKRRYLEHKKKRIEKPYDEVLSEMKSRDENDSKRSLAPLKKAEDAMLIDTTEMTAEDVLALVLSAVKRGICDAL